MHVSQWGFALCLLLAAPLAPADERVDRLPEVHKRWLERDVAYIITAAERDVFLSLETLEERDRFIEVFWKKRDPNLATPENEYRIEHYRRVDYANTYLGRGTFREGWQTDQGRYYIILGEPRDIQRFDGYSEVVGNHLWFYQGNPAMGTPSFFYLLFFRKNDSGEYRLYHPVRDGPAELLSGSHAIAGMDSRRAVQALREVSAELAAASLSFDTSEPPDYDSARPALGTGIMMARIDESPRRAIRTDYADAWLRYGNRVSAEYSFNFVPSRHVFSILADRSGTALVQYSIEIDPEHFTLETDERRTKFYTTLDLTVEARTSDGVLVYANDKEAYVELSPSQMRELGASPFAYQDDFPLVPGDYTVAVIVRNRVVTQYTVAEAELHVPRFVQAEPRLTDVILAFDTRTVGGVDDKARVRTYQVGDLQVQPAAQNLFVLGDTVHLVAQAFGASAEHRVVFELTSHGERLRALESRVGSNGMVLDHLKLEGMNGGNYELATKLLSPAGETLDEKRTSMVVSPRSVAIRPGFVYRRGLNTRVPGLLSFMRGEQHWNRGEFRAAKAALEEAVATGNPRVVPAQWMLANVYLREERPDEALKLLAPLEEAFPNQYDVVAGLGFTAYLKGNYEKANAYLTRARSIRPPDTMLLNALGDSLQRVGQLDEARAAFERSLELDSEQPAVQERLRSLGAGTK